MDFIIPEFSLISLTQDNFSLKEHICEFLLMANVVNYEDDILISFFNNKLLRLLLSASGPQGMLCQFLVLAL